MKQKPHLAITLGDPCGIGPELLLKILPILCNDWQITIYGSSVGLAILPENNFGFEIKNNKLYFNSTEFAWVDPVPEISFKDLRIGVPSALSGICAIQAVKQATIDICSGKADALLTLPLSKTAISLAGIETIGHTELLQKITNTPRVQMAFISPSLKVVLHTVHQSLRSVLQELNPESVAETLIFTAQQFDSVFKKKHARVALCAINPHAGEGGIFGMEEKILEQSIEIATNFFKDSLSIQPEFTGPHPADNLFLRATKNEFDVVVAIYHDQGLIPIKLIESEHAVNCTLGLPFIRTSPGHGTAFDIAGKWIANPINSLAAGELAYSLLGDSYETDSNNHR
ncbi:MAG: 4-hydroxythreonine-4-phosphate dehydrogenase PdxA [Holophagaceae bacterium]|nr:4-hydroxythreonine-4-phosphate dehydrogenase PdxA [Holophagaceae bacterium]